MTGLKKISEPEEKIFKGRLNGRSFCELAGNDLQASVDQIMLRGAAISGCNLPGTDFFAQIISQEIITFINEYGYSELTMAEILTAMRLNAKGGLRWPGGDYIEKVYFSGNCFNIDYLSKILSNYKSLRDYLDRRLQNLIDGYE